MIGSRDGGGTRHMAGELVRAVAQVGGVLGLCTLAFVAGVVVGGVAAGYRADQQQAQEQQPAQQQPAQQQPAQDRERGREQPRGKAARHHGR